MEWLTPFSLLLMAGLAEHGAIELDSYGSYTYKYDPLKNNKNARTLQSFSTEAKEHMWDCQFGAGKSNCPYPTYTKFYQYYGSFDYGKHVINHGIARTNDGPS